MAGRASTIPISARVVGRSPSSSPASTEKPAAPTALIGPATLNAACRNPRYSASAPVVPPRPATAPQASAAAAGRWDAAKGSAAVTDDRADRRGEQRDLDDPGPAGGEPGGEVRSAVTDRRRQRQHDG